MTTQLRLDGSHGEGGGQILRTALALSAMTGRAIRVEKIRAERKNPGLAAQHLTAVRALGTICGAEVGGDRIGSQELTFSPKSAPQSGDYLFDVSEAREGGSAGSATLLLQALVIPLASAEGDSTLTLRGGTHVAWSPPFDYVEDVFLPALSRMGWRVEAELMRWGWFPAGGGEMRVRIHGGQRCHFDTVSEGSHHSPRGSTIPQCKVTSSAPSKLYERHVQKGSVRRISSCHAHGSSPGRNRRLT